MPPKLIQTLPPPALARTHDLQQLAESAAAYAEHSQAANTKKAYRTHWAQFEQWCRQAIPAIDPRHAEPPHIALYLTYLADAGKKPSTITVHLAAIADRYAATGLVPPTSLRSPIVKHTWNGIKRRRGLAQTRKEAATTPVLLQFFEQLPDTLSGRRDRALLLIGFAGAFRRSELVALDVEDIKEVKEGLAITLRRSKTDQEAEGRVVGIPYGSHMETCPVRNYRAWLEASGIASGPVFPSINRHGKINAPRLCEKSVALIVKRYARAAGLKSFDFAGHSLRAGLATAAAINGVAEREIMQQTGHKSAAMVRRYIRDGSLFRNNAAAKVGL